MTPLKKIGPRRFEYSEGPSNKFWEIIVSGKDLTVTFGRIGTSGQAQLKSLEDGTSATKHADKLIGQKLAKGYREVA